MINENQWFIEEDEVGGSIFGVKLREHLHSEQTEFQQIDIYATEKFGNVMVIDGFFMLTARENFIYHEMMSHPALFTHPSPENVVIIGGGDCGTLREVLRHARVTHALQVEIDERVTRLAEEFFPELCVSNNDSRAEFLFGDGIRWMRVSQCSSSLSSVLPIRSRTWRITIWPMIGLVAIGVKHSGPA